MAGSPSDPARRLRRKLTLAVWLGRLARQAALLLVLCGASALLARVLLELDLRGAALFFLPLAVVPFTAWAGVRRSVPDEEGATAWLDLHSGARGFLLADLQHRDERWASRTREQLERLSDLPSLRLSRFAAPFLPALAFALLALFVPLSRAEPGPSTSLFDRAIEGLREKLGTLDEIVDLDEVVADELAKRIEHLAENVDATEPEAMLEAIDTLRDQLGLEGQEAAEVAQLLFDEFGAIGESAFSDPQLAQELMLGRMKEMLASGALPGVLEQLDGFLPGLTEALAGTELNLPAGFELDPAQLQGLSRELREALRRNVGQLNLAGLVDLKELSLSDPSDLLDQLVDRFHVCDEECKKPGGT